MEKKYKKGLFMGRFQPATIGHMYTVIEALKLCDELVIGIGSTTESGTEKNPLDAEARREILEAAIAGEGVDMNRVSIILIPDVKDDDVWFSYIKEKCPDLSVMFTDNSWCIDICKKWNVNVETPLLNRDSISATNMRGLMVNGGDWRPLAPKGAVDIIEKHIPEIKTALNNNKQKLPS
ncbi:MAG: adenylyltransferase/cytidyltransferase family protein [Candidatus Micrarchaeales archaeon]|jgi:nicotinamide-nucleotide adenylyltransferase